MKNFISAWFVSFLVMYILSVLWYGFIIADYNSVQFAAVLRGPETFSMQKITVGYLLLPALLTLIYPFGYKGGNRVNEGFRFGLLMGVFWAFPAAFINSGAYEFPLLPAFVDAVYHTGEITLGGIAVALVRKK